MNGNKQGDRKYFEDQGKLSDIKRIQTSLNNLGFTDKNGNKLNVDGNFGDRTEEAYNKYLAKKDELEQAYFDENLSDDDIKKYNITTEVTGVGQTRVIDLNNISSGPTMIENSATILERKIQGGVQDLINAGVSINDPNYQRTVKSLIYQLNQTGPAGIKSLIFDGLNTDDDDIFTSENTNSFIEGVIANNAEEFGIKDPDNITPQQLEDAIEKLKEGDVTIQYLNKDGKKESLQRQFLGWYKELIDTKVEAGVKSRFSSTTGKIIKGGRIGGGSDRTGNKNIPTPNEKTSYSKTQQQFVKDTTVRKLITSDLDNIESATDVLKILQPIIDEKNKLMVEYTNPLLKPQGGMKIDSGVIIELGFGGNPLKILKRDEEGEFKLVKKFDFNPGGRGTPRFLASERWKNEVLPDIIKVFNDVMITRFPETGFAEPEAETETLDQ